MHEDRIEKILIPSVRKYNWRNIIFFAVTHLTALIIAPIYIYNYGIPTPILWLTLFYFAATGLSITVGYHRLFAHRTFDAPSPLIRFLVLFFGAASFEESALTWCSQHRTHHQYVDTDLDPYNIKKGFFYAHMGWMMFWKHTRISPNVKDLQKDPILMNQHDHYTMWAIFAGMVVPGVIGIACGHFWGAAILAVCTRITAVFQGTFCINSVCHTFGKRTYDIHASARDNWFNALFTWGEGYHNFHHRFPNDYRNGVRWYAWDPSKWSIWFLEKIGLASNLKRTSPFTILNARILAENRRAALHLEQVQKSRRQVTHAYELVQKKYDHVVSLLHEWEEHLKNHNVLKDAYDRHSPALQSSLATLRDAQKRFQEARKEWVELVRYKIYMPQFIALPA